MTGIFDRARASIKEATTRPDPERAMEALGAEAKPEDLHMVALFLGGTCPAPRGSPPEEADAP